MEAPRADQFLIKLQDLCREFNVALGADTIEKEWNHLAVIQLVAPGEGVFLYRRIGASEAVSEKTPTYGREPFSTGQDYGD